VKRKKLLILAVMLTTILSVWQVSLASGSGEPLPPQEPSITVHKFHDANRNGVQDAGEEDIEGWLIRLYRADHNGLYVVAEGLTGADGTVVFSGEGIVVTSYKVWEELRECWEPTTPPDMGLWEGGYYTRVTLSWDNPSAAVEFGNVYNCAPPPPPSPGTGTPGYWKNHPEAWPVDEIVIGGITYSKDEAIDLMGSPEKGDKTYTLFRALVAAKLNGLIGNDTSCVEDTIAAADEWLSDHPPGSGVKAGGKNSPWRDAEPEPLYEKLDAYNNGGLCAPARD
jgi:hypothetical protein